MKRNTNDKVARVSARKSTFGYGFYCGVITLYENGRERWSEPCNRTFTSRESAINYARQEATEYLENKLGLGKIDWSGNSAYPIN